MHDVIHKIEKKKKRICKQFVFESVLKKVKKKCVRQKKKKTGRRQGRFKADLPDCRGRGEEREGQGQFLANGKRMELDRDVFYEELIRGSEVVRQGWMEGNRGAGKVSWSVIAEKESKLNVRKLGGSDSV